MHACSWPSSLSLSSSCLPLFCPARKEGRHAKFYPLLVSSERKGTPMGVGALEEVFINPPPCHPKGFRTTTTPAPAPAPARIDSQTRARTESSYSYRRRMMMDKQIVRQCDMEVMKMAMLKHEETFRQQVHELHRLYRIQRELMSDLTRGAPAQLMTTRRRSKQPRRALNLQLPADEYIVSADEDEGDAAGTELELTLAIGGGRCSAAGGGRRKSSHRRRQAAEQRDNAGSGGGSSPFGSDCSGASVLSSSPPSSAEYYSDDGPAVFHALPPPPPPCQRVVAFDLGEGMMMRQHAPWLVQCQQYLSLRMT